MSYLASLTFRLTAGAMQLPEELRHRHAAYLAAAQQADGGFAGRQGPSDLYYTGFALRGLALVGELNEDTASRSADFLQTRLGQTLPIIDFLSLVLSAVLLDALTGTDIFARAGLDRKATVLEKIAPFRRDDGGYAKTERGPHSSTYHTFLAAACKQLVDLPLDEAPRMVELVRSRRRDDGGFVELGRLEQGGTNPTAAAIGLLRLFDALDDQDRAGAIGFLAGMQNVEGGLRANTKIPTADLLSTFTGLVALADLEGLSAVEPGAARQYAQFLELRGGFRGGIWDQEADVEYTFYGLGTLALLAANVA